MVKLCDVNHQVGFRRYRMGIVGWIVFWMLSRGITHRMGTNPRLNRRCDRIDFRRKWRFEQMRLVSLYKRSVHLTLFPAILYLIIHLDVIGGREVFPFCEIGDFGSLSEPIWVWKGYYRSNCRSGRYAFAKIRHAGIEPVTFQGKHATLPLSHLTRLSRKG